MGFLMGGATRHFLMVIFIGILIMYSLWGVKYLIDGLRLVLNGDT